MRHSHRHPAPPRDSPLAIGIDNGMHAFAALTIPNADAGTEASHRDHPPSHPATSDTHGCDRSRFDGYARDGSWHLGIAVAVKPRLAPGPWQGELETGGTVFDPLKPDLSEGPYICSRRFAAATAYERAWACSSISGLLCAVRVQRFLFRRFTLAILDCCEPVLR